jgi:hypothetical protein
VHVPIIRIGNDKFGLRDARRHVVEAIKSWPSRAAAVAEQETEPGRRPFLVALGVLMVFVFGVAALTISLALDIRPSVSSRPSLWEKCGGSGQAGATAAAGTGRSGPGPGSSGTCSGRSGGSAGHTGAGCSVARARAPGPDTWAGAVGSGATAPYARARTLGPRSPARAAGSWYSARPGSWAPALSGSPGLPPVTARV